LCEWGINRIVGSPHGRYMGGKQKPEKEESGKKEKL
jgi:hypothetical protein